MPYMPLCGGGEAHVALRLLAGSARLDYKGANGALST